MASVTAAADLDRLPWLTDEKVPQRKRGSRSLLPWAVAALVPIAAISYWLGSATAPQPVEPVDSLPSATVRLPEPQAAAPEFDEVQPTPLAEVLPTPAAPVAEPVQVRRATPVHRSAPTKRAHRVTTTQSLQLWPARRTQGAAGRLVRVGAFASSRQAKLGWWRIMRINPALRRLPAVVVPVRSLRNGRIYYRLQMGTTSQAHSEVLCQRMRSIAISCVVVGVQAR